MLDTLRRALANPKRGPVFGIVVVGAALGIAASVWLSNGGGKTGGHCPVQAAARAAIDKAAQGNLAALRPTADGRGYADLKFQDDTGRPMTLKDFSGKPILVNFWATWCVPCRKEMPALNAIAGKYGGDNFAVVPINLDLGVTGVEKAQKFYKDENLPNLPLYADPTFTAFDRLKSAGVAVGLPTTLLLDASGCELAVLSGPAAWDSPDGENVIEALIALGLKKT